MSDSVSVAGPSVMQRVKHKHVNSFGCASPHLTHDVDGLLYGGLPGTAAPSSGSMFEISPTVLMAFSRPDVLISLLLSSAPSGEVRPSRAVNQICGEFAVWEDARCAVCVLGRTSPDDREGYRGAADDCLHFGRLAPSSPLTTINFLREDR